MVGLFMTGQSIAAFKSRQFCLKMLCLAKISRILAKYSARVVFWLVNLIQVHTVSIILLCLATFFAYNAAQKLGPVGSCFLELGDSSKNNQMALKSHKSN